MEIDFSLDQIDEVARELMVQASYKVFLFQAGMGAGKTTLIKALCRELGIIDPISSPTFSLVNEYEVPSGGSVYHFDFYRINSESEALDFGVDDYLYSGEYCFLEWPEKIPNLIPDKYNLIEITILSDGKRRLRLS